MALTDFEELLEEEPCTHLHDLRRQGLQLPSQNPGQQAAQQRAHGARALEARRHVLPQLCVALQAQADIHGCLGRSCRVFLRCAYTCTCLCQELSSSRIQAGLLKFSA